MERNFVFVVLLLMVSIAYASGVLKSFGGVIGSGVEAYCERSTPEEQKEYLADLKLFTKNHTLTITCGPPNPKTPPGRPK